MSVLLCKCASSCACVCRVCSSRKRALCLCLISSHIFCSTHKTTSSTATFEKWQKKKNRRKMEKRKKKTSKNGKTNKNSLCLARTKCSIRFDSFFDVSACVWMRDFSIIVLEARVRRSLGPVKDENDEKWIFGGKATYETMKSKMQWSSCVDAFAAHRKSIENLVVACVCVCWLLCSCGSRLRIVSRYDFFNFSIFFLQQFESVCVLLRVSGLSSRAGSVHTSKIIANFWWSGYFGISHHRFAAKFSEFIGLFENHRNSH